MNPPDLKPTEKNIQIISKKAFSLLELLLVLFILSLVSTPVIRLFSHDFRSKRLEVHAKSVQRDIERARNLSRLFDFDLHLQIQMTKNGTWLDWQVFYYPEKNAHKALKKLMKHSPKKRFLKGVYIFDAANPSKDLQCMFIGRDEPQMVKDLMISGSYPLKTIHFTSSRGRQSREQKRVWKLCLGHFAGEPSSLSRL